MTEILTKIINDEVNLNTLKKWLTKANQSELDYKDYGNILKCKCSQTDFLSYFLNYVHEDIPCQHKSDTPQKPKLVKTNESTTKNEQCLIKRKLFTNIGGTEINKSSSFPPSLNSSLDGLTLGNVCSPPSLHSSRSSSTPKLKSAETDSSLTNSYLSPVSPLHTNYNNFSTPKSKRQNLDFKSTEKFSPLCLGDFLVVKRNPKKKSNFSPLKENSAESFKRIKPTSLKQVKEICGFRQAENSFNNFQNTQEISFDSVNKSRSFLADERLKILSKQDSSEQIQVTNKIVQTAPNFNLEVEPKPDLVSFKQKLDLIVEIYDFILKNDLVLNLTSEIYFLISLLLEKQFQNKDSILGNEEITLAKNSENNAKNVIMTSNLFETIHNIVYFSVQSLELQINILKYYDKSTLKILSQNKRLKIFSQDFSNKLNFISESKQERIVEIYDGLSCIQSNVCFNSDTDNRENFPNDQCFHAFRKQRDLFYEILRIWEEGHLTPGWNFQASLGGRIANLFELQRDPANFMHFSRLFKAQLLSSCSRPENEQISNDQISFLSLPNMDADKLKRLKSRLVTRDTCSGLSSLPTFVGIQEFYKEFIVYASNSTFNKHLCDTIIVEIVELNDNKFQCTDLEEKSNVEPSTRKKFVNCLASLRVLAKFLGFIESLPYSSQSSVYSENLISSCVNVRKQTSPSLDIKNCLLTSIQQNNIVLTVPWIVEYLSMLDYVTLRLPYYLSVSKELFNLYRKYKEPFTRDSYNFNASFVKFTLGWLFELPHFPHAEYFSYCGRFAGDKNKNKVKIDTCKNRVLDNVEIVDQNVLYICCPYLEEIKRILTSNVLNRNVIVRHITPLTAAQSTGEMAKKKLEQQLEESFFNGQPLSVRKTVEFVSERVASSCVKHICQNVVPDFKKKSIIDLRLSLEDWRKTFDLVTDEEKRKTKKAEIRNRVNETILEKLKMLQIKCKEETNEIIAEKMPTAIDGLSPVDFLPQAKNACFSIAKKSCLERVNQWTLSHVTLNVFKKDFETELQKILSQEPLRKVVKQKPVFVLPGSGKGGTHNENTLSAFHLFETLRNLSLDILNFYCDVEENVILNVLKDCYRTFTERCDVNQVITVNICHFLVDFCLILAIRKPFLMSNKDFLKLLVDIWKFNHEKPDNLFKNILCPRNVMLFAQSRSVPLSWEAFAFFVAFLIKEELLSCDTFESECVGFFKKDWDEVTLTNVSNFVKRFTSCYKENGGDVNKFSLMLEFLSDFCINL